MHSICASESYYTFCSHLSGCIVAPIIAHLQDDTVWEWEKLFAEVSSEIQSVWERGRGQTHPEPEDKTEPLPS